MSDNAKRFRMGDAILIGCDGWTIPGTVLFASPNGASLMLEFEAILDGHVAMMPVLRQDDGSYQAIMTGTPVELRERC